MKLHRSVWRLASLFVVCGLAVPATAESPLGFRQLVMISPVAVQRGTEGELKIHSNLTLDGAHAVFFDKPGIALTYAEEKTLEASLQGRGTPGNPYRFKYSVPAEQGPGVYEVRVATNRAVSSVSHLFVTDYPVIEAEAGHDTREKAQVVSVPVAIAGVCEKPEDVDFYKFTATAGQQLNLQIFAQRVTEAIHSMQSGAVYLMDPILTLYSPLGQVVAQNDNHFGGDALIEYTIPSDGEYTLEVRDARYIGNPKYVYCVEISDRPFAHALFPLVVQQGTTTNVEIVGHMPEGFQPPPLTAGTETEPGFAEMRFETPVGMTNAVRYAVSPHPQQIAAGNTTREAALELALPCGVSGRFLQPDEEHFYKFEATAGRFYVFEVTAQTFGLPLDSVLQITAADGKVLTEADDGLQTKDSLVYFKAPADGTYYLSVSDLHGRGGERFLYHLRAEPGEPDFNVHGEYYYAMLAPGTRMIWFARIERLNGFDGPVEISVEGLPEGVTATPVTIPAGMTTCGLILSAAADAPINASLVQVYGTATISDGTESTRVIRRQGRVTCELQTRGGGQARWPIHTQLVGVTQPLDLLSVTAGVDEITLKPGEQVEIPVKIERKEGFDDAVTLAMQFDYFSTVFGQQLPPGVKMLPTSKFRLNKGVSEGTIVLECDPKQYVAVERLPIAVMARVSISFSITTNYASQPIYLTIPAAEAKN